MAEECTHDCSSCGESCAERQTDFRAKLNEMSSVRKVIAVLSGKGGVGKSLVTSMLAVLAKRAGYKSAILAADVTGPSIPKAFGLAQKAQGSDVGIFPVQSKTGIPVMSINLLLDNDTDPVIWRGPVIAGVVKQFWTDVVWGDVDFMFVDMPPGTGDVPLTVFQSLPVDGIFVVTSPQELVSMVVAKAANMAKLMNIPIIGIIENMSGFKCPDCGKEYKIFGDSHVTEIADEHGLDVLAKIPMDPALAKVCDDGTVELFEGDYLDAAVARLIEKNEPKV